MIALCHLIESYCSTCLIIHYFRFSDFYRIFFFFFSFGAHRVCCDVSLRKTEEEEYNYDVEDFLLRLIYLNLYNFGSYQSYCSPYQTCDDCTRCPISNYSVFADAVCIIFSI